MIDPRDPAPHHYEMEPDQLPITQGRKQLELLEQIRNGISIVAVILFLIGAGLFLGLIAASAS